MVGAPALNELSQDACRLMGGDWAGVGLIVDDNQVVIASSGGRVGRYERARSIMAYAILEPDAVLCVLDAPADERFGGNPFVRVGLIRFFVAAPIVDERGFALGALCVSSRSPRQQVEQSTIEALRALATQVPKAAQT
ncbi:GAF domain-containing protein [Sphingomonas phyllosphaerae]|uniref:GAF domain-containing protein n=1 Tax=Sphingomonas phyllosphaerae TaxID=257003 RepID=UPI0009DBDBF6|nr:GAF domain-containing protein [Sphingomonas phyllosphaerae]